jgi:hypothetical protein
MVEMSALNLQVDFLGLLKFEAKWTALPVVELAGTRQLGFKGYKELG